MGLFGKTWRAARAAMRRDDGNATIEFVFLFPAIITVVLMAVEIGFLQTRSVLLDRAVDLAMREIRLGTLTPMNVTGLKQAICNRSILIPDCLNSLTIELRPISTTTWGPLTGATQCVDRSQNITPVLQFTPGVKNELMLVRVCSVYEPFFPTSALAGKLQHDASGSYALVSMSAFVNEP